jgi:hypothetical protein
MMFLEDSEIFFNKFNRVRDVKQKITVKEEQEGLNFLVRGYKYNFNKLR